MDKEKQEFGERIADRLFIDGRGIEAVRLVHEQKTKLNGPGLCKQVVIDVIRKEKDQEIAALKAEIEILKAEAEEKQHVSDNMGFDIEQLLAEIEQKDEALVAVELLIRNNLRNGYSSYELGRAKEIIDQALHIKEESETNEQG